MDAGQSTTVGVPDAEAAARHTAALERAQTARALLQDTRNDRWYPRFHVAAPAGWMNDPNGVCFHNGRFHVYYQHFPDAAQWGPMHWGHASSADLVHWRHEPIALAPSLPEDADGVWSGSAIEAPDGRLLVFYTGNRWRNGVDDTDGLVQVQMVASSTDGGTTFTKGGVVIDTPEGIGDFRDPKVWLQGDTYCMVVAATSLQGRGQVWLYTSPDLEAWSFDRVIFTDPNPAVHMLECPDLFELDGHWVLLYGPMTTARPQGYLNRNGHNTGYVVGKWSLGGEFVPSTDYTQYDWGHHYYAPQTMRAPDGRRLSFGWMGGFTLPLASQQADAWSGQLAVPRELHLTDDLRLSASPIGEVARLRRTSTDLGSFELGVDADRVLIGAAPGDDAQALEIELEVDLAASSAEQVCLLVHQTSSDGFATSQFTKVCFDALANRVGIDRGVTARTDRGYRSAPFTGGDTLRLRVLVDRGSVEVFIGDDTAAVSSLSFPGVGVRRVTLASVAGTVAVTSLRLHELGSIWDDAD